MKLVNRIEVLDKGFVQLLDTMPCYMCETAPEYDWADLFNRINHLGAFDDVELMPMDKEIVRCARVSFSNTKEHTSYQDAKLLWRLMSDKHTSPFEMGDFKFQLSLPNVSAIQMLRHRTASLNSSSGRYSEQDESRVYIPGATEWRLQSKDNKQGSSGYLPEDIGHTITQDLIEYANMGFTLYEEKLKQGVAREMARFFLPANILYVDWVWKMDLHNLMHFLRLRCAQDAQYEVRVYADAIKAIARQYAPLTFAAFDFLNQSKHLV